MRWESAAPVQQALSRRPEQLQIDDTRGDRAKAAPESEAKDSYVIAVLGLRMPDRRFGSGNDSDEPNDTSRMRERLMRATTLTVKGRAAIAPSDVKVSSEYGQNDARFFFPRTNPISLDDKEVTFESHLGPVKIEQKFHVKDMLYRGKLAL